MGNQTRLGYFDMLRAVAAMSVVITHMLARTSPAFREFRLSLFDPGCFGVTLFFLCSGYVIPRSIERADSISAGLVRFWVKRLLRLYPAYWVSVVLIVGCYLAGIAKPPGDGTINASQILVQLTMLQKFFGQPYFLVVYWTLTYEIIFYVTVSALFATRTLQHTAMIVTVLTAASVCCDAVLPAFGFVPVHPGLLSFLSIMFCGTLVYRWRSGVLPGWQVAGIIGLNLLAFWLISWATGVRGGNPWAKLHQMSGCAAGLTVFAATVLWEPQRIPRVLLWLGTISYSIYLLHMIVLAVVPQAASAPVSWMLWTAVTILASAVCYATVERPGMELGTRLAAALAGRPGDRDSALQQAAMPERSAVR
jgi:peptidoglycan/LPS O-acetylase OafA/YrhL